MVETANELALVQQQLRDPAIEGKIVEIILAPILFNLSAALTIDANTRASELRLISTNGTVLRASSGLPLLHMLLGAPPVLLRGLKLQGRLLIEAGALQVDDCTLEGGHAESDGGALSVTGGRVVARRSSFLRNRADGNGGAIHVNGGITFLEGCLLEANIAGGSGGALHVGSGSIILRRGTLLRGNSASGPGSSIYVVDGNDPVVYQLPAPLGRWVDSRSADAVITVGSTNDDYPSACSPGLYGDSFDHQSSPQCRGPCTAGHVCPIATVTPRPCGAGNYCPGTDATGRLGAPTALPCRAGTYSSSVDLTHADQCTQSSPGFYASTGSIESQRCSIGTYAPTGGLGACHLCSAGRFASSSGQTACTNCTAGSLCLEGSSAPQPCPGGTHADQELLASIGFLSNLTTGCIRCTIGTFCPVGSAAPTNCSAGTYNSREKQGSCVKCEAGRFQKEEGATGCDECTLGSYCLPGASAALPCPAGTHQDLTLTTPMTSEAQCIVCGAGTFCPIGAEAPTNCSAGTFSEVARQPECIKCAAGTFQSQEGAQVCRVCDPGYYCPLGASVPLPCPGVLKRLYKPMTSSCWALTSISPFDPVRWYLQRRDWGH